MESGNNCTATGQDVFKGDQKEGGVLAAFFRGGLLAKGRGHQGGRGVTQENFSISPRNGELSEKGGSGCRADWFLGPGEKHYAGRAQLKANGCILATATESKN